MAQEAPHESTTWIIIHNFVLIYLVTNKYMMSNLVLKESIYTYKQSKNVSQGDEAWDQSGKRWDCATKIPDHLLSFSLEREGNWTLLATKLWDWAVIKSKVLEA